MSLHNAAWDMLHAVEAADAAGELADNIGGELIDALREELDKLDAADDQDYRETRNDAMRSMFDENDLPSKPDAAAGAGSTVVRTIEYRIPPELDRRINRLQMQVHNLTVWAERHQAIHQEVEDVVVDIDNETLSLFDKTDDNSEGGSFPSVSGKDGA